MEQYRGGPRSELMETGFWLRRRKDMLRGKRKYRTILEDGRGKREERCVLRDGDLSFLLGVTELEFGEGEGK